uniref:Uncharacterized protein n=1 Tax=Anopheles dirus TaxID=7168 RepID=A0A182NXR2_9DIPT
RAHTHTHTRLGLIYSSRQSRTLPALFLPFNSNTPAGQVSPPSGGLPFASLHFQHYTARSRARTAMVAR